MGKWTLGHHDDVLRTKFKNLVNGAVKRLKLEGGGVEGGEPSISYEAFVEELDEGDSFTTTLIDVLVKEMADRRTRTNILDRRLISERTAKSLRMQAAPLHVYHGLRSASRFASRPGFNIVYTDLEANIQPSDDEDEHADNHSAQSDPDAPLEGARLNTELHDAYASGTYITPAFDILGNLSPSETSPLATGSPDAQTSRATFTVTSPRPLSPVLPSITYRSGPWSHNASSGSSGLTRQHSIRRPARSRTVDFNEFTQRRRSSIRQNSQEQDYVRSEESADGTWRFRTTFHPPAHEEPTTFSSNPSSGPGEGRYTSASPWSHIRRRHEVGGAFPWSPDPSEPSQDHNQSDAQVASSSTSPSSSQLWYSLTATAPSRPEPLTGTSTRRASIGDINEARRQVIAPRLRRGGVRPPESLLSRHASPVVGEEFYEGEGVSSAPAGERERSTLGVGTSAMPYFTAFARSYTEGGGDTSEATDTERTGDDARQLPTPRSITPAYEAQE